MIVAIRRPCSQPTAELRTSQTTSTFNRSCVPDLLSSLIDQPASSAIGPLRIDFDKAPLAKLLVDRNVLAIIEFDSEPHNSADARLIGVDLPLLSGERVCEVWRCDRPVSSGHAGSVQWSSDGHWCQFAVSVDEADHGDIATSARVAYDRLAKFLRDHPQLHVLRLWNYFDAITEGEGDGERYRQFNIGREQGLQGLFDGGFPAATAIGSQSGRRTVQVYGLASRQRGTAIENPRQLSSWRYPREYGPVSPGFARAMLAPRDLLLISGTAAIVGHASQFGSDLAAQTDEMLENLRSLITASHENKATRTNGALLLKAYVRGSDDVPFVTERLRDALPELAGLIVLGGQVCRRELVVEIEGVLG